MMELKLKFTDKENVPYLLIFKEEELASGVVNLKNMITGEEKKVLLNDLSASISVKNDLSRPYSLCGIH
jgi:histidyl-tRNA synthetase